MTESDQDLLDIFERLQATGLPCLIVGAVAASMYGEPRGTLDIDLLVAAGATDAERIRSAFADERFYVPPIDTMRRELARDRGTFHIIDSVTGLKADIYPAGSDPLHAYAFKHPNTCVVSGKRLQLAPATYVVAMKLRYYAMSRQDKLLRDIRGILALSSAKVDVDLVELVARESGTADVWHECGQRPGEE